MGARRALVEGVAATMELTFFSSLGSYIVGHREDMDRADTGVGYEDGFL